MATGDNIITARQIAAETGMITVEEKFDEIDGRLEQLFGGFLKRKLEKLADDIQKQSDDFVSLSVTVADIEPKNKQKQ